MVKNAFPKIVTNSNNTGLKYYINSPTEKANDFSHLCLEIWSFVKTKLKLQDIATDTVWFCRQGV